MAESNSDRPGDHLDEEPQAERGEPGSRDTGSDEPAGGPVDRATGSSDEESDTSVDSQDAGSSPMLQTGDGG